MKKNFWLIVGILISTSVWADQAIVAPAHSEPSKAPAKKSAKRTPVVELRTVPLVAGPAVVAVSPTSRVNVRGQGKLSSEIVTHMTNGEPVVVIEEVHLARSAMSEPSAWAKIVLPAKAHVWVSGLYVDQTNMTVKATKLKVRAGAGENFSALGMMQQGDAIKEISRKNGWIEIENPGNAYAFMAAQYLKQEPVMVDGATETPATTAVSETAAVAATSDSPIEAASGTNVMISPATGEIIPAATESAAVVQEPPPPRIVQREGTVRGTFSIQAPSKYALISDNGKTINYLHTTSPDLDLSRYKGLHIIVTGEEGLDERWRNTPVLTIQRIQVLD